MTRKIAAAMIFGLIVSAGPALAGDPMAGEAIYNKSCKLCHTSGMMGAPKLGDKAAWADRIAKGDSVLLDSTKNGLNKMPARGTCNACSDEELENAITFMVNHSQ